MQLVLDRKALPLLVLVPVSHMLLKLLYSYIRHKRIHSTLKNVPTFVGHWFFGSGPSFRKNIFRLSEWKLDQFVKTKNVVFRSSVISSECVIMTTDPAVVKHILKDQFGIWTKQNPNKNVFSYYFREWIGDGIFVAPHGPYSIDNGQLWTSSRKVASKIFTRDNFRESMATTFVDNAKVVVESLKNGEKGKPVDMQAVFFAFTMDSIMKLFFGKDTNTLNGKEDLFAAAYDDAHRALVRFFFMNISTLLLLDMLPFPFGPLHPRNKVGIAAKVFVHFTREGKQFFKAVSDLNRISYEIIDEKLKDPNLSTQKDLLAMFMNAEDDNGVLFSDPKHRKFLRDTVLNFVIAGRDTTACSLTWLFYILATNPTVQEKLCEEIDRVLKGRLPTHDDVVGSDMPYLNGVVYETLRLYPPVSEDGKNAHADDVLPDGTKIRAGTTITYFPYGMGRDAERYPDPLEVKPERWIPFVKPSDYDFPVFQAGPRICLGMNMALLEIKLLTSIILQNYTFTLLEGEKEKIGLSLMITKSLCNSLTKDSHNLWLIPHPRH